MVVLVNIYVIRKVRVITLENYSIEINVSEVLITQ